MTTRPIANKYREGKLKRTLKREFNLNWTTTLTEVFRAFPRL